MLDHNVCSGHVDNSRLLRRSPTSADHSAEHLAALFDNQYLTKLRSNMVSGKKIEYETLVEHSVRGLNAIQLLASTINEYGNSLGAAGQDDGLQLRDINIRASSVEQALGNHDRLFAELALKFTDETDARRVATTQQIAASALILVAASGVGLSLVLVLAAGTIGAWLLIPMEAFLGLASVI